MLRPRFGFSPLRLGVFAVVLSLIASVAGWSPPLAGSPAAAQVPGLVQVTLVGRIRDSIGAPQPLYSAVRAVLTQSVITTSGTLQLPNCAAGSPDAYGVYRLVLQPYVTGCITSGAIISRLVNNVPVMQTFVLPPSSGTHEFDVTLAVPLGGQPLPPPPLLPPAVAPASSGTTVGATALNPGCSQVIVSPGPGATPAQLAAAIADPSALVAIWHYDNAAQRFTGYFPDPSAPSDFTSLATVDTVFICVSAATSITTP